MRGTAGPEVVGRTELLGSRRTMNRSKLDYKDAIVLRSTATVATYLCYIYDNRFLFL